MLGIGPAIDPGVMPFVGILYLCRHDVSYCCPAFRVIGSFSFGNNEGLGLSPSLTSCVSCRWLFPEDHSSDQLNFLARRILRQAVL